MIEELLKRIGQLEDKVDLLPKGTAHALDQMREINNLLLYFSEVSWFVF
jgi:hypothetical protein